MSEMNIYDTNILALCEVRVSDFGKMAFSQKGTSDVLGELMGNTTKDLLLSWINSPRKIW